MVADGRAVGDLRVQGNRWVCRQGVAEHHAGLSRTQDVWAGVVDVRQQDVALMQPVQYWVLSCGGSGGLVVCVQVPQPLP
eukprot:1378788-Amphidinium_carterae.1